MSENVDNGSTGFVELPFFKGTVGIKVRDDYTELAYFGFEPTVSFPVIGKLDGNKIRVTKAQSRDLDKLTYTKAKADVVRVVTLTVVFI